MKRQYEQPTVSIIQMHPASIVCTSNVTNGTRYETDDNDYIGGFGDQGNGTGKNGYGIWSGDPD